MKATRSSLRPTAAFVILAAVLVVSIPPSRPAQAIGEKDVVVTNPATSPALVSDVNEAGQPYDPLVEPGLFMRHGFQGGAGGAGARSQRGASRV